MSIEKTSIPFPLSQNQAIVEMLEMIRQPLVIIDSEMRIKYANEAYLIFFKTSKKISENEYLFKFDNDVWDTRTLYKQLRHSIVNNTKLQDFKITLTFPLIGERTLQINASPINNQNYPERVLMLSIEDTTKREMDSFLESILNTTQNLIYIYDFEKQKIVFINKKALKATGYTAEEIQKSQTDLFTQLIHDDDVKRMQQHRKRIQRLNDGKMNPIEYRLKNKEGKWTHQLSRDLVFKRNSEGKVIQYVGVSTNVSDIVNANKLLLVKNEALENSNNELDSFSSIASHDLKEPLRKIQMFGKLIMERENETLSEFSNKYLEKMVDAANRMQQLIDDLISYSRTGFHKNEFTQTDLNGLLSEVIEEIRDTIEASNVIIDISEMGTMPLLPSQFRQLFMNLINNAIKYRRKDVDSHIAITSKAATAEEIKKLNGNLQTSYYKITLTDNGIGFPNEYRNKIFEPFQRLHNNQEYSGTGIGLAICKKIVQNHHGFIVAESNEDKGAQFDIYIPNL